MGLVGMVVEFLVQGEGLPQGREGLFMVPEPSVVPADIGERGRVPDPVTGGLEQAEGLLRGVQRLGGAAMQAGHEVAEVVGPRLSDEIAQLTAQVERTVEMEMGVVVAAQVGTCHGETAVGAGLLGRIAQPVGGVQRGLLGGDPVVPASALVEESE